MSPCLQAMMSANIGIVCCLVLVGCGGAQPPAAAPVERVGEVRIHEVAPGTTPKLAFITNNQSEFWRIALKGVAKADAELGTATQIRTPENGRPDQQNRIIEQLIAEGFHGIAISLISPSEQTAELDRAVGRLNVITHDSDAPRSQRLAYIGTNNHEAGRVLGNVLRKQMPVGGRVAAFVGTLAADNASQRLKGLQEVLAGSRIEIVLTKEDNKDPVRARANVEEVIATRPDVTGFIGLWSYNTPQIAVAAKASGKAGRFVIVGFDDEQATLDAIADGVVKAAVVQKPFEFGYRSVKLLHGLAVKGAAALPREPIIDTGVEVVTSDNVAAFSARQSDLRK